MKPLRADPNAALDGARQWAQRGYYPLPVPYREKGAKLKGWQNLRLTPVFSFFNHLHLWVR
jgi:hypothetical protein